MKKSLIATFVSLLVILGCGFYLFSQKKATNSPVKQASNANFALSKKTNTSSDNNVNFSNDEWMLMGYMAYARQNYVEKDHIKNTTELVQAISQDLNDGSLKAARTGNNYHLGNKYGSVALNVTKDQVIVSEGANYTANKADLKKTFSSYLSQIKQMTGAIKTESAQEFTNLSDNEYIIAAFVESNGDGISPASRIAAVNKTLSDDQSKNAKQIKIDKYYQGFFDDDSRFGKTIATNLSTSGFIGYKINNGQITATGYQGGSKTGKSTYFLADLKNKYAAYKNQLDQIMQKIQYNKQHVKEVQELMIKN